MLQRLVIHLSPLVDLIKKGFSTTFSNGIYTIYELNSDWVRSISKSYCRLYQVNYITPGLEDSGTVAATQKVICLK